MKIAALLLSLFITATASAGPQGSGGGKGVVCRSPSHKILSVELLDLWESRNVFQRSVLKSNKPVAALLHDVLLRLKESYPMCVSAMTHSCDEQDAFLFYLQDTAKIFLTPNSSVKRMRGVTLTLTDDSYELARPNNCNIEQIVNYQDDGLILVNQDLYDKLDVVNQTALIAHETLYARLRNYAHETNSIRTRRAVGYAMSGGVFTYALPSIPANHVECYDIGIPLAPTMLALFWSGNEPSVDSGGMFNLVVQESHGTTFMEASGLTTSQNYDIGGNHLYWNLLSSATSGVCDQEGPGFVNETFSFKWSPVEFGRKITVQWMCNNGRLETYLLDEPPGQNQTSTPRRLTCKAFSE